MNFTDAEIMALRPGKDGPRLRTGHNGLYLYLHETGVRSWRFETRQGETRRTVTIGHWPEYDFEKAKKLQAFYRLQMTLGFTPREIRDALRGMPEKPELRLAKMKDGRTLLICAPSGDKRMDFDSLPELENYIDITEEAITGDSLLSRDIYFAFEAWKLKRELAND